jgi:hypothetical protein
MTDDVMWGFFWLFWGMALLCVLSYFFEKTMLVIIAIGAIAVMVYFMLFWPLMELFK